MINFLKHVVYMAIAVAIGLGALKLVLDSGNVKQAEYHHCMVTSTDKTLCETIIK